MVVEYGSIEKYSPRGFGFLRRLLGEGLVYFHIKQIADHAVRQQLDSATHRPPDFRFWFTVVSAPKGPQAGELWQRAVDVPTNALIGWASRLKDYVGSPHWNSGAFGAMLSDLFGNDELSDTHLSALVRSPLFVSNPQRALSILRQSQYTEYASVLKLDEIWCNLNQHLPGWAEPATRQLLGAARLDELQTQRQALADKKEQERAEAERQRWKAEQERQEKARQDQAREEARRKAEAAARLEAERQTVAESPFRAGLERLLERGHSLKPDWCAIQQILVANRVTCFYHFTDKSNLDSIVQAGGLYSWAECQRLGIDINCPGGDDLSRQLDWRKGLINYVRLSFAEELPMLYVAIRDRRVPNPILLRIDPAVALVSGTRFSDENATANAALIGDDANALHRVDFRVIATGWHTEAEKHLYQAEVLVHKHVPLELILDE